MGDFFSLGSNKCSNIDGHKGTGCTKVVCGHLTQKTVVGHTKVYIMYFLIQLSVTVGLCNIDKCMIKNTFHKPQTCHIYI